MDNTQSDDLPMMKATVEDFIYDKTGHRVRIVFDDMFKIRIHTQMLTNCYAYVVQQKHEEKVN